MLFTLQLYEPQVKQEDPASQRKNASTKFVINQDSTCLVNTIIDISTVEPQLSKSPLSKPLVIQTLF